MRQLIGSALVTLCLTGLACHRPSNSPTPASGTPEQGSDVASVARKGPPGVGDASEPKKRPGSASSVVLQKAPADTAATPEGLVGQLKAKNRGFEGRVEMQPISVDLMALGIHDRNLKDISPLARQRLGTLDLSGCDISDVSALEGLPLMGLFLEENERLTDISALRGMPLRKLYLSHTGVENLGPLRGMPLTELNLVGTRVRDLSPLAECPIEMLWLSQCPVEDVSPLSKMPLVSLTLEDTKVSDLSPLARHPMERLHIAGTEVTDLTPLGTMRLKRLIFTPGKIKQGLDVVRQMDTLEELGTTFRDTFDNRMPPQTFWELFDKGELK